MQVHKALFVRTEKDYSNRVNEKIITKPIVNQPEKIKTEINFPGLNHVVDTSNGLWLKILWVMIIFFTTVICCYQMFDRFQYFLTNPVSSKIRLLINESIKLPDVTICAKYGNTPLLKAARDAEAVKQNKQGGCEVNITELISENVTFYDIWKKIIAYEEVQQFLFHRGLFFTGYKTEFPVIKETIILDKGMCDRHYIKQLVPYLSNNHKMLFGFPVDKNLCDKFEIVQFMIHSHDEDLMFKMDTLTLFKESRVGLDVELKQYHFLNTTNRICDNADVVNKCKNRCLINIFKQLDTCRPPYLDTEELRPCANSTEAERIMSVTLKMHMEFSYDQNCTCPRNCNQLDYRWNLRDTTTDHPLKTTFLQVGYDTNYIENIEEYYAYSLISMLCDVGGNLGLYLGLCIPSVIELFQSFICLAFKRASDKK